MRVIETIKNVIICRNIVHIMFFSFPNHADVNPIWFLFAPKKNTSTLCADDFISKNFKFADEMF